MPYKVSVFIPVTTYSDGDVPITEKSSLPSRGLPDIGAFNEAQIAEEVCEPNLQLSTKRILLYQISEDLCVAPIRANVFVASDVTFDWFLTDEAVASRIQEVDGFIDDNGVVKLIESGKLGLEDIADEDPLYGGILTESFADDDCDLGRFALEIVVQEYCARVVRKGGKGLLRYRVPFYPPSQN